MHTLTSARKSIACKSKVARAGITSWIVVASCIVMTAICAHFTFIHICSYNQKWMWSRSVVTFIPVAIADACAVSTDCGIIAENTMCQPTYIMCWLHVSVSLTDRNLERVTSSGSYNPTTKLSQVISLTITQVFVKLPTSHNTYFHTGKMKNFHMKNGSSRTTHDILLCWDAVLDAVSPISSKRMEYYHTPW